MTDNLDLILTASDDELLDALPTYQKELIAELLSSDSNPLSVAKTWLAAKQQSTAGFGGRRAGNIYLEKIVEELEKLICGDEKYKVERDKISTTTNVAINVVITSISAAIGAAIGIAAVVVMPVVVLILTTAGKIGKNAWCEARKTIRECK